MSKVKLVKGVARTTTGKDLENLNDVLREQSKCGCGIDCCNGVLRLKNLDDGTEMVVYLWAGVLQVQTYADFLANGAGDQS